MAAVDVLIPLFLLYFVEEVTSTLPYVKYKKTGIAECNICGLGSNVETVGSATAVSLQNAEGPVEPAADSQEVTHNAKRKDTLKLECNICELESKEAPQSVHTNPEDVVNSSANCDIADRDVFPGTKCPSEMNWIHKLEVLTESAATSA